MKIATARTTATEILRDWLLIRTVFRLGRKPWRLLALLIHFEGLPWRRN